MLEGDLVGGKICVHGYGPRVLGGTAPLLYSLLLLLLLVLAEVLVY